MASVAERIRTGVSLAVGVGLVLYANRYAPAGLVPWGVTTALLAGCVWELGRMPLIVGRGSSRALLTAALGAVVVGLLWCVGAKPYLAGPSLIQAFAFFYAWSAILAFGASRLAGRGQSPAPRAVSAVLLAVWVVPPFPALVLFDGAFGTRGLLALVLLSKIGDVFGYFIGRQFGRIRPFRVSPGKSVEGCAASLVAGIVAGVWAAHGGLLPGTSLAGGALLGALLNLAAQAGDFFESWIKRRAEIKDSSALAGASGGILDVVDSLLFTAPLALVLWPLLVGN